MKGTIKRFYFKKGFGFIENEDGEELFFHYSDFEGPKRLLRSDTAVTFTESEGDKGLCAIDLQIEGYDPSTDPERDQHTQERANKPARAKPAGKKTKRPGGGGSLVTGLVIGFLIGLAVGWAAGYYSIMNMSAVGG